MFFGENTEKCITFSVPIKNEITKPDNDGNEKITKTSYKKSLLIAFDLCQAHYQTLLKIY